MHPTYITLHLSSYPRSLKFRPAQVDSQFTETKIRSLSLRGVVTPWRLLLMLLSLATSIGSPHANAQATPPASDRITINLSEGVPNFVGNAAATNPTAALPQSNWWYENNQDSPSFAARGYVEDAAPSADTGPSCGSTLSMPIGRRWAYQPMRIYGEALSISHRVAEMGLSVDKIAGIVCISRSILRMQTARSWSSSRVPIPARRFTSMARC